MSLSKIGYKILITAGALTLFASPALAFTYTRTPSNPGAVDLPINIKINLQAGDICGGADGLKVGFSSQNPANGITVYTAIIQPLVVGDNNFNFATISNGLQNFNNTTPIAAVIVQEMTGSGGCNYIGNGGLGDTSNQDPNVSWYATSAPPPPPPPPPPATTTAAFITPVGAAAAILSNVSGQFADPGTLAFMVLASGIIVGFWVLRKFLKVMPK